MGFAEGVVEVVEGVVEVDNGGWELEAEVDKAAAVEIVHCKCFDCKFYILFLC